MHTTPTTRFASIKAHQVGSGKHLNPNKKTLLQKQKIILPKQNFFCLENYFLLKSKSSTVTS